MNVAKWFVAASLASAAAHTPGVAAADPVLGQVDDFEDGTTQGWRINLLGIGSPPAEVLPVNIPDGGPGGDGDGFLRMTSLGTAGPGGRLVALNLDDRWTGNYLASGVSALRMDLNNLGTTDLALRILFERTDGGPPTDIAWSTLPVLLPAGGGWTTATFDIRPDDLTAGLGSIHDALEFASVIRIFHSPASEFPGPPTVAVLGVDNIQAVPEPASWRMVVAGLLGLAALGRAGRLARRPAA